MNLKDWQFDASHVKSWAEEGKKAGAYALAAFQTVEKGVQDMLLTVAIIIAGTPSAEDFLTGYAGAWSNPDTGKSRKADARAVFEAFAVKDANGKPLESYERTVGYEKNADGSNKVGEDKMPIAIRESKSPQDWLKEYDGDWKGFLSLAREIRNGGTGRSSQGTTVSRRKNVTPKQFDSIMEALPVASAKQAETIAHAASAVILKLPNFEVAILGQMEMLTNQLKSSKQPIYVEAAARIIDVLNELRDEVRAATKMQADAKAATAAQSGVQGDLKAPMPAQQQSKAA